MKQLIKNILKEYSINEGIKPHPKEEEFKQYQGIIDDVVYGVVNEDDLCGYRTEFFLNAGEDALQIVLYYKKGRYPGYVEFTEKQIEIKNTLETYLPIIEMAFVSYDSTRCKETIKESEDTEIERNLNVIRTLLSQVNWEGLCDIWVEYNERDGDYEIRSKYVRDFSIGDDYFEELEFLSNVIKSMGLRVYVFTPWFVDNCDDEVEFINESKDTEIEKNLKVINTLLSLVSWDGLCDIWVEYNPEDGHYEIRSKTTASYFRDNDIEQELESLENSLRSMGMSVYIYIPRYVENCEDEFRFLNESENKKSNYLDLINDIVEPFKNDEGVCDIDMWYDDENDMYSVYLVFGTEELNGKFTHDGKYYYIRKKIIAVKKAIKSYLPIDNLNVGSYGKPNCGLNSINESKEESKKELIETILNTMVLPEYEHVICGFEVKEPHERFDFVGGKPFNHTSVTVTFIGGPGTKLWPQTPRIQDMYEDILNEIWDVIYNYTNEGVDMYHKTVKDCGKDNIYLRESKEEGDKKNSLIKNIRNIGLYDFIRMMGISLEEVQSQVGQIPREMLEQFIKDYISNKGLQYSSYRPDEKIVTIDIIVGGNAIIDFIYYDGKVLSFEVTEYANGFSKEETDQYIEGSKNYGYNTIFKIVEKIIRKIS